MMTTGFKSALPTASSSSKAGCRSLPSSGGGKALFSSLNGKGKILSVGHVSGGGAGGAGKPRWGGSGGSGDQPGGLPGLWAWYLGLLEVAPVRLSLFRAQGSEMGLGGYEDHGPG